MTSYYIPARLLAAIILVLIFASQLHIQIVNSMEPSGQIRVTRCTVHIAAVSSAGGGVLGNLTVEIHWPGEGRVFISTSPAAEVDTQGSARLAALAASMLAGVDPLQLDFYYDISSPSIIIGGPSAGAAMALATLNLLLGLPCNQSIVATGMIEPDGTIGPVGGLKEKLEAVAEAGGKMFLVPAGQEVYTYTQRKLERIGPVIIVKNVPVTVNLTELGEELGVRVVGVPSLLAALRAEGYNIVPSSPGAGYSGSTVESIVDRVYRWLSGNYTSLEPGSNSLGDDASRYHSSASTLNQSDLTVLAVREEVKALARLDASRWLGDVSSAAYKVTGIVEEVNQTLEEAWSTLSNITPSTVEQASLLVESYKMLAYASLHFSNAMGGLEEENGDYYLRYGLFTGVDTEPLVELGLAKWLASTALMFASQIPYASGMPVSGEEPSKVASLLTATARSAAAYLYTLLEEAGGDTGLAGNALYLADTAVTSDSPWEAIGAALASIVEVTKTIYSVFPVPASTVASGLWDEALIILSRNGTSVLAMELADEASALNASVALYFLAEAVLTGWTTQLLSSGGSTQPLVEEWNEPPVTGNWTPGLVFHNESGNYGQGTGGPNGSAGGFGVDALFMLAIGMIAGGIVAVMVIAYLERKAGKG